MAIISDILKPIKSHQVKNVAIYTFANFFNKSISFLLLFYFAHVLTENDFGLFNLFNNSILFLMPFVSLGILQSASTEYFKLDKKEFKSFFSTSLLMPVAVTVITTALLFLFKPKLQQHYSFPSLLIFIIPINTFFSFLNEHLINMVRNNNDSVKYLFINIGRLLAEIVLAVFFISAIGMGWTGRVTGIFVSYLFVAGYALFYFKEQGFLSFNIQKKYIKAELLYSIPIIAMQISIFCMGSSAGYFIQYYTHNLAAVGVFSMAITFGSIILVLCTALLQYTYPHVYSVLAKKNIDYNIIRKHFLFYSGALLLGTSAVIIATPVAYNYILNFSYHQGLSYYIYICLGNFFWGISYFFYAFMLYKKEKLKLLTASLFSILLSLVSHTLFTKYFGAYGAAVSICLVYFIVLLITILLVYKDAKLVFKLYPAKDEKNN